MYKTIILILFIWSIIYISASIAKSIGEKNPRFAKEKIVYKNIPEPLETEDILVSELFASMFDVPKIQTYK